MSHRRAPPREKRRAKWYLDLVKRGDRIEQLLGQQVLPGQQVGAAGLHRRGHFHELVGEEPLELRVARQLVGVTMLTSGERPCPVGQGADRKNVALK